KEVVGKIDNYHPHFLSTSQSRRLLTTRNIFLQFLDANQIEPGRRRSVFLSVVGPKVFALLKDLISPKTFGEVSLSGLLEVLRNFYTQKKNVLAERFAFRSRQQQPGETFADYIASLKGLAATCDFVANLEDQLRDQFVCGTSSRELRWKLLGAAGGEGLAWQKMVEITNSFECTNAGLESMQKGQISSQLRTDHVGVCRDGRFGDKPCPPCEILCLSNENI
uniref:Retrotransposon gag domain-containing protein n=1 Tax=Paramormyrops kingsleyae TaxID=1676925 RepID=A0A3B3QSK6_9TELE